MNGTHLRGMAVLIKVLTMNKLGALYYGEVEKWEIHSKMRTDPDHLM